ncbi:MAG: hypothetical protein BDTLLHRC_001147 [Candidatus Fervidibacter sp.]
MAKVKLFGIVFGCILFTFAVCGHRWGVSSQEDVFAFVLPVGDTSQSWVDLRFLNEPVTDFVQVKDGHFFANGKRIRFWGVNFPVAWALPQTKRDAEIVAQRLAKFGVNAVRLSHLDRASERTKGFAIVADDGKSLLPDRLDLLDYFVAQLKRNGIYIYLTTCFHTLAGKANFPSWEGKPSYPSIDLLYAPMMERQKEFMRNLFSHRNPYTGNRYADEPAVAIVEIANEAGLIKWWRHSQLDGAMTTEPYASEFSRLWNEWLMRNYRTSENLRKAWGDNSVTLSSVPLVRRKDWDKVAPTARRDWVKFLLETEEKYFAEMVRFLKGELKVKAPIVPSQVGFIAPSVAAKYGDVGDFHAYWSHPNFPSRPWDSRDWYVEDRPFVSTAALRSSTLAYWGIERRLKGKPWTVSEIQFCAPNTFRAEGLPLLAAYASLQDWDGVFVFAYSHGRAMGIRFFDLHQDPVRMINFAIGALMFRRFDVRPALKEISWSMTEEDEIGWLVRDLLPWARQISGIGWLHRITFTPLSERTVPLPIVSPAQKLLVADTGEIVWDLTEDGRGVITVNTPKTKSVIGFAGGRRFELGRVTVEPQADKISLPNREVVGFCVVTVQSLDGGSLDDGTAKRILVTATAFAQNSGWDLQVYGDGKDPLKITLQDRWGNLPTLVQGVNAKIELPYPASRIKGWALNERGQPQTELPVEDITSGRCFIAIGSRWRTLWYGLEAKD